MPQLLIKRVKPLVALCMDNVVSNMDKWCDKHISEGASFRGLESEFVSSHFERLPSDCLLYMTEYLMRYDEIKEEMLSLLLNPNLQVMLFHNYKELLTAKGMHSTLRLVSTRCPQLTTLVLSRATDLNPQEHFFSDILLLFENLQVLIFKYSEIDYSFFPIIGSSSCKAKLRELDITGCDNVDDAGLEKICIAQKSLQKLNCSQTDITMAGVIFALQHLPELQEFVHDVDKLDTFELFKPLHEAAKNKLCLTKLPLPTYGELYTTGSIAIIASLCHSLVHLDIYDCGFGKEVTDEEFKGFGELKNLKTLNFWSVTDMLTDSSISLHGGVAPLLQIIGHQLEELTLENVPFLHVPQIDILIECCPYLLKLHFGVVKGDSPDELVQPPFNPPNAIISSFLPLQKLEKLALSSLNLDTIFAFQPQMLLSFLSSPNLKSVNIVGCETLSDEILQQANAIHCFQHLKMLKLSFCPSVSQKGIGLFMNENNNLNHLILNSCHGIDSKSIEHWEIMTEKKNWQLCIDYENILYSLFGRLLFP